jgi:hypothetical protein
VGQSITFVAWAAGGIDPYQPLAWLKGTELIGETIWSSVVGASGPVFSVLGTQASSEPYSCVVTDSNNGTTWVEVKLGKDLTKEE